MFIIVCLFGRQFLKSGILVDFTALKLCFDENSKDQEILMKKTQNLKKMSIMVTEKVKTLINQDTVIDEDILNSLDSGQDQSNTE